MALFSVCGQPALQCSQPRTHISKSTGIGTPRSHSTAARPMAKPPNSAVTTQDAAQGSLRTATCGSLHPVDPAIDLALCLVLGDAVALLDAANQLVLLAVDDRNVVLGQLAPLLLDLAGELLPVAFNAIPIHLASPLGIGLLALRDARSTWQYWCGCPQGLGRFPLRGASRLPT